MIGRTLSHYRIESQLGAGGMGVVYRAFDERLKRPVALKVLRESVLTDADSRRLLRHEASALLRLSHPRIGTLFDFDSVEGVDFLVMEFVAGEALDQRIARGPLAQDEAVALALQIGEALEEAHDKGVIHRDLKPGNVIVSPRGQLKVVDFGLAKLARLGTTSGQETQSQTRTADHELKGTLAYMAPEQLRGDPVDARTDVYALGLVMYEMVTGERAFRGTSTLSLMNAIMHETPAAPRSVARGVSPAFERLILGCMERDPERRPADAGAVLRELRRLATSTGRGRPGSYSGAGRRRWLIAGAVVAAAAVGAFLWRDPLSQRFARPGIRSIAVLPLENLSGDPQQEYFTDGMTDALISSLGGLTSLRVISRASVMRYKNARVPLSQIASELDVEAVVAGTVVRSGDAVRITAELVDAGRDQQLWSSRYDRTLGDVLAVQSEIASAITEDLRRRLAAGGRGAARTTTAHVATPEAQEAYLKARYYSTKGSEGMLQVSLKLFGDAIAADPEYAQAHAGLANAYVLLAAAGTMAPAEAYGRAAEAARRALVLDDGLAEAHAALGLVLFRYDWDRAGAERELQRALELSPGSANVQSWYSALLSAEGRHGQAISAARRAVELDPLSLPLQLDLGVRLYYARRFAEASGEFRRVLELEPGYGEAHYWRALSLQQTGEPEAAISELAHVEGPSAIGPLGYVYAVSGRSAEAGRILSDLAGLAGSGQGYVSPFDLATICAGLGRRDEAIAWLGKSLAARETVLTTLQVDPRLDSLRNDPRFAEIAKRVEASS